jgi:glycosyltransferase involved in cell wall biosynthesis
MSFGPNAAAAVHLVQHIMPMIWSVRPGTQLLLVGRNPTPAVLALAGPLVVVTGEVCDIRAHLLTAQVFVCPLHTGAGIKNKVLQAWALALPVVTTSMGAQGLGAVDGKDLLVRDDDAGLATAVLRLLDDADLRQRLANAGRQAAVTRFSWAEMAQRFETVLQRAATARDPVH